MGKHSSTRESPDVSAWLLVANPLCLLFGLYAVWTGAVIINGPATCDMKTMTAADVCATGRKLLDEQLLVDAAPTPPTDGKYRTYAQQQSFNRVAGPGRVIVGLVVVAGSLWLGLAQARGLQTRRELRRRQVRGAAAGQDNKGGLADTRPP